MTAGASGISETERGESLLDGGAFTTFIIFVNVLFAGKRPLECECHLARRHILPCFGMAAQAF